MIPVSDVPLARLAILRPCRLVLLLGLGLSGCASDGPVDGGPIRYQAFESADLDHDGKLNRDEAATLLEIARYFERLDADHSGYLSWSEVRAGRFPVFRPPLLPDSSRP